MFAFLTDFSLGQFAIIRNNMDEEKPSFNYMMFMSQSSFMDDENHSNTTLFHSRLINDNTLKEVIRLTFENRLLMKELAKYRKSLSKSFKNWIKEGTAQSIGNFMEQYGHLLENQINSMQIKIDNFKAETDLQIIDQERCAEEQVQLHTLIDICKHELHNMTEQNQFEEKELKEYYKEKKRLVQLMIAGEEKKMFLINQKREKEEEITKIENLTRQRNSLSTEQQYYDQKEAQITSLLIKQREIIHNREKIREEMQILNFNIHKFQQQFQAKSQRLKSIAAKRQNIKNLHLQKQQIKKNKYLLNQKINRIQKQKSDRYIEKVVSQFSKLQRKSAILLQKSISISKDSAKTPDINFIVQLIERQQ